MLDENIELKLLRGDSIKVDDHIIIKSFTLSNILDNVGQNEYNSYLYYMAYTPFDLRVALYEHDVLYTKITHWDLFLDFFRNKDKDENKGFIKSVESLTSVDINNYTLIKKDSNTILVNKFNRHEIDEFKHKYIVDIIRRMNNLTNSVPKFGNKIAVEYEIERHTRSLKRNRNNSNTNLRSIISSVCWTDYSLDIFNIWRLTTYQLYDALNRRTKKEHYDNIMLGIYTGNIKSDTINFNKENWLNNK